MLLIKAKAVNNVVLFTTMCFSLMSCVITNTVSKHRIKQSILDNHQEVEKVEILYDSGIYYMELTLEITFHDGKKLLLIRVNKEKRGNIWLRRIGDYGIYAYSYSTRHPGNEISYNAIYTGIIAKETGVQLNDVDDIIMHYNDIYNYVNSLEDINSEKYAHINKVWSAWAWNPEWGFKIIEYTWQTPGPVLKTVNNFGKFILFKEKWQPDKYYWYY